MAKMFYTLQEAAEKLGMDEDTIKQMATEGKLQQFRDRDKLMFKRDQVDALAGTAAGGSMAGSVDSGISLASPDDTDTIDLMSDTGKPLPPPPAAADETAAADNTASATGTGISVFDAGEIDAADPMAQTQVTSTSIGDDDLALESVGSGSGLLDLTRESDDTSLGAELLDEIYPGAGGDPTDTSLDSAAGSSGVFEGAISMETGASGPSGLENLGEPSPVEPSIVSSAPQATAAMMAPEAYDPAGSGLAAGIFVGTMLTLILGLLAVVAGLAGARSAITSMMTASGSSLYIWCGGLLVLTAILGVAGMFIGKSVGNK